MEVLQTMAYFKIEDLLVACFGNMDMSEEDLVVWLERLSRPDWEKLLLSARGCGTMSAKQRSRMLEMYKEYKKKYNINPKIAMVSNALFPRLVTNALSMLLGLEIKAFRLSELSESVSYLGAQIEAPRLQEALDKAHRHVD